MLRIWISLMKKITTILSKYSGSRGVSTGGCQAMGEGVVRENCGLIVLKALCLGGNFKMTCAV